MIRSRNMLLKIVIKIRRQAQTFWNLGANDIPFKKKSINSDRQECEKYLPFKNIPTFAGGFFKRPFDSQKKESVNQNISKPKNTDRFKSNPVPKNQSILTSFFVSEHKNK
jgi:hypothetical protein